MNQAILDIKITDKTQSDFQEEIFESTQIKILRGASAMKLRRMQRWFDRSPVNMFPEPVFTLDFSTKMSIIQ